MDWQQAAVAMLALGATGYLVLLGLRGRRGACGGCDSACAGPTADATPAAEEPALVQLALQPPAQNGATGGVPGDQAAARSGSCSSASNAGEQRSS